jgi:hypothetical protein
MSVLNDMRIAEASRFVMAASLASTSQSSFIGDSFY